MTALLILALAAGSGLCLGLALLLGRTRPTALHSAEFWESEAGRRLEAQYLAYRQEQL